jgi:hypothetical protein
MRPLRPAHRLFRVLAAAVLGIAATARAHSSLFGTGTLSAQAGFTMPRGNLDGVLRPAPAFGLRFATSYYAAAEAFAFAEGAWLEARRGAVPVLFAAFGVGLEWAGLPAWLPRPGAGAAMYEARIEAEDDPGNRFPLLHGGESEFGCFPSLRWQMALGERFILWGGGRWDLIFTSPRYTHAAELGLGAGWRWR